MGLLALPLLVFLASFFFVPPIARTQIVKLLEAQTGGSVEIGEIRFNPFTLRADLASFSLREEGAEQPVVSFASLLVDARWLGFLNSDVAFESLVLVEPDLLLEISPSGDFNLVQLLSGSEEERAAASDEPESAPLLVDVDVLKVEGGHLLVRDLRKSPAFELELAPLDLQMDGLSTAPGRSGQYTLSCSVDETASLAWKGSISNDPIRSEGDLRLEGFDLHRAAAYARDNLNFELAKGALSAEAKYALDMGEGVLLEVDGAKVSIAGLSLLDPEKNAEFLGLKSIEVGPTEIKVGAGGLEKLVVETVKVDGGRLATVRAKDGVVRIVELLSPRETGDTAESTSSSASSSALAGEARDSVVPEIQVGAVELSDLEVAFEDRVPTVPVRLALAELKASVKGYSSKAKEPLKLDVASRVGETGRLKVAGPLRIEPLSGQLKIEAEGIGLSEWSPYLEGVAQLEIPGGRLGAALDLSLEDRSGELAVSAKGRAQIDDLKTLDRSNARRFVDWGSLRLEGLDYSPEAFVLSELVLSKAMARVVRDAKGGSNLDSIFAPPKQGASPAKDAASGEAAPLAMRVDRVTLEDVGFAFADLAPDPNFTMDLSALTGTIEGLSSEGGTRAEVNLEGRIDDTAPVRVSGKINPLSSDAFTDVKVRVSGVSMPTFSPYAGRFAGYGIERGRLDLDLAYKLNHKKLRAENHIDLHEFRFGQSVKSADATTLPLPLVAEILRRPNGDIRLDIPLRGNLDDPSFNLLELLSKTFVNIITRIATSPFSIVEALIPGGGEKISKVQFAGGSSELSAAEGEELGILADVLLKKPALRVEIRGRADPAADEAGLREALGSRDAMTDADWRSLARARAKAVYDRLISNPEIDPDRLFMVAVEVGVYADEAGQVASQIGLRAR
ncbi:MAG: DUF748 domain-containing protein [Myxococcota bacterium]